MRGKLAKKLRKIAKKYAQANWLEYASAICNWPLRHRLRFAWDVVFNAKKYRLKGKKK